jgi:hypothetical protein
MLCEVEKKGSGKENVSVGFHPLVKVFAVGEKVSNSVSMTGDMFELEVKVLEKLNPVGLAACDLLQLSEIL